MADKKISHLIMETCKQEGIDYKSINPNYSNFCEDATKLGEYCTEILALIDKIDNILEKHQIRVEIKEKITKEVRDLHTLERDLIKLAYQLKEKND